MSCNVDFCTGGETAAATAGPVVDQPWTYVGDHDLCPEYLGRKTHHLHQPSLPEQKLTAHMRMIREKANVIFDLIMRTAESP